MLSVVSRLFEKLVYEQLNTYLSHNNVYTHYQSGFRRGQSTATSLLSTTDIWFVNINEGLINGVICFLTSKKLSTQLIITYY